MHPFSRPLTGGSGSGVSQASLDAATAGYEFTGGFTDRTTGTAGASDIGTDVAYTQAMVDAGQWKRFGFDTASQIANDVPYWTDPTPASAAGVGLFGGSNMPGGVTSLFDYSFSDSNYSDEVSTGSLQYTAADGSFDMSQLDAGDFVNVRFDFNVTPQVSNTTVEVALIWQTRDNAGNPTFSFALTGQPIFFGTGTVGETYLNRPILSAYIASNEDINARALLAVRADNPFLCQPLTTLFSVIR